MKKFGKLLALGLMATAAVACSSPADEAAGAQEVENQVVNVYSSRHYDSDRDLFEQFEEKTGITVNLLEGTTIELMERVNRERNNPQADLFIDVGVTALYEFLQEDLLEAHNSSVASELEEGMAGDNWLALTNRARAIVYDKEASSDVQIASYTDLMNAEFHNEILVRSSTNIYNIALVAGLIQAYGEDVAREFSVGIAENMAREPYGNDRDQARAMVAGEGSYSLMSTYYIQMLRTSSDPNDVMVGERLGIAFPEETFVDISWMGVINSAANRDNAVKLMEFLLTEEAQTKTMLQNGELPVNANVAIADEVLDLYDFNRLELNYEELGRYMRQAMMMMDEAGWR